MRSFGRLFATSIGPLSGVVGLLSWFGIVPSSLADWVSGHIWLTVGIVIAGNALMLWIYRSRIAGIRATSGIVASPSPANQLVAEQEPAASTAPREQPGCLTFQANAGCFSAQISLMAIVLMVASVVVLRETVFHPERDAGDATPTVGAIALITPTPGRSATEAAGETTDIGDPTGSYSVPPTGPSGSRATPGATPVAATPHPFALPGGSPVPWPRDPPPTPAVIMSPTASP